MRRDPLTAGGFGFAGCLSARGIDFSLEHDVALKFVLVGTPADDPGLSLKKR